VLDDERLELTDEIRLAPEREVGLDSLLEAGEAEVLEARDLRLRERLVSEIRKRRPAPEGERFTQVRGRLSRGLIRERLPCLRQKPLEASRVEFVRRKGEQVAACPRGEALADISRGGGKGLPKL
jgi:hypothetical protein